MRDIRAGTAGPKAKPPRPHHVRALRLADARAKREKKIAATTAAKPKPPDTLQNRLKSLQAGQTRTINRLSAGIGTDKHGFGERFVGDLLEAGVFAIPSAALAARHPIRAAKQIKKQYGYTYGPATHGDFGTTAHRLSQHPGYAALDASAAISVGAGVGSRVAAAGRAAHAGENAVTRSAVKGGGLIHKPAPGTAKLTAGQATVEKPLSRNAARAVVQKARYAKKQQRLNVAKGVYKEKAATSPGRLLERHGSEAEFGKRLAVQRRLEQAGPNAKGDLEHMRRAVRQLPRKNRRGTHAAMRVVAIEGDKAFKNPAAVIDRQIAMHEKWIAEGGDKVSHQGAIRDLKLALPVLEKQSPAFLKAVTAVRDVAQHGESESVARGFLTQAGADKRRLAIARDYGHYGDKKSFEVNTSELKKVQARATKELAGLKDPKDYGELGRREYLQKIASDPQAAKFYLQDVARRAAGPNVDKPPEGSFYFHAGQTRDVRMPGRVWNQRPGKLGVGPAKPGQYDPGLTHQYTGSGLKRGYVPLDIPKAVEQSFSRRIVLHSRHDVYDTLKKASTATRESRYQIPLRTGKNISDELRKYMATVEDHIHASPDEVQKLTHDMAEHLKQQLEAAEHHQAPLGANIKGVRWVDERFLKDLGETSMRGTVEKIADAVNNPIRFGTLYVRPAYMLNLLGNAAMVAPEGPAGVSSMWHAVRSEHEYGTRLTAYLDSSMGSGRALGQSVNTGFLHKGPQALAQGWNAVTDLHIRRGTMVLEAKRAGFKGKEGLQKLYAPGNEAKLREVTERARSIIGDYENLSAAEKNTIRRIIYFYPWTKVAVNWTGHMLGEHPVESALLAANGRVEAKHVAKVLGLLPAWAKQSGLLPVGKAHGVPGSQLINTINPSSINTPASVTQTGSALANTGRALVGIKQHPGAGLSDLVTPALQAVLSAGGQAGDTSRRTGILGAAEATPIPSALRRAGVYGKPSKTYPTTGVGAAVNPLLFGGLAKRPTSLDALHKAGEKEVTANMTPEQKTARVFTKWRTQADVILKQHGVKMPKEYAARLDLWHERTVARKRAGNHWEDHIAADLDVIFAHGWIDHEQLVAAKANIQKIPENKHAALSKQLTDEYFDRDGILHQGAKEMGLKLPR